METIKTYLERKHEELRLLNDCLRTPVPLPRPQSVSEVVRHKFKLTAALKAEHALHDWDATETDWSHASQPHAGPFAFAYDYQRADLEVRGPSFYALGGEGAGETIYTASGMAAISALLLACADVIGRADILVAAGSYGETLELIARYARHLRLATLQASLDEARAPTAVRRILLLDSCAPACGFEAALRSEAPRLDLLIFDTTCFCAGSGRIRRVLRWAHQRQIPTIMVRSHTKLDSLGAEYGRLGSAVFVRWDDHGPLAQLPTEMRNAVRLLGGAALPAHFPPYIGTPSYRALTKRRVAAMLHNGRRASRYLSSAIPDLTAELRFAHGVYITLGSTRPLDESSARSAAADMSDDLARVGLPIRHAGSFGFDFAAAEWFHNATTDRYSVRIAMPDLPTDMWDELTEAIARWWLAHQRRAASEREVAITAPCK